MMTLLTLWPYFLLIPALLLGITLGWHLRSGGVNGLHDRTRQVHQSNDQARQELQGAELELMDLKRCLSDVSQDITIARSQLQTLKNQYANLLLEIDEQREAITSACTTEPTYDSNPVEHDLRETREDRLLSEIDTDDRDIFMLEQICNQNKARIASFNQQLDLQQRDLGMLQGAINRKNSEIEAAESLIEQRESELRRLARTRRQVEKDIECANIHLSQCHEKLSRIVDSQPRKVVISQQSSRSVLNSEPDSFQE